LYSVLTARSFSGVKIAVLPLQVTLAAAIGMRLTALRRTVCVLIVLQFIGTLKLMVTAVLTGTLTASSAGSVEVTMGREAAAVPTIPTTTTNAAMENLLTIYLSIIVIFLVENMRFISLVTCI
jgi:hypothetical protein